MKKGITFLFLLLASYGNAQTINTSALDSLFDFIQEQNMHSISVQLKKNGKVIYQRAAGFERIGSYSSAVDKALDKNSVFLIGSITKTYTATLIMQLVEEGKLQLSDKLSRFFPQVPNADKIDMKMLLRHRSGLFNYTASQKFTEEVVQPVSKEELIERFAKLDTLFSPGAKYEYSNTNYMLLGFILEELSGLSYEELLRKQILEPLQLKHTYYGRPVDRSHMALSYTGTDTSWVLSEPEWNTDWAAAAGGIATTVNDLSLFYHALFNGKLISENSLKQMTELKDGYGFGLSRIPYYEKVFYGHGGRIQDFRSICGYLPEEDVQFTQLSNADRANTNDITIQLLNAVYGRSVELPKVKQQYKVPLAILKSYEGSYSTPSIPLLIRVFVKDGQLYGQASGQSAFPLTSHSNTDFSFSTAGIELRFFEEAGKQKFHFLQHGARMVYTRKPAF